MKYDAVIIGGGAAGLFCAIEAGKRGRRTLATRAGLRRLTVGRQERK